MAELEFEKWIEGILKIMKGCESYIGMTLAEAVEKQIPKAPVVERYLLCPTCGDYLRYSDKHCSACGQKIDWEAVNDE